MQLTPNQVFVKKWLDNDDTFELTSIVKIDNSNSCKDYFWSKAIDIVEETKGLPEKTTWKKIGRYISEPLNVLNSSHVVNESVETEIE